MSGRSGKFFQNIASRIVKSPTFNNATSALENATGRAQLQFANMQNVASEKYDTIVKQVNGATMIQDLNAAALQRPPPIPVKLVNWWRWYQQLTGMDDVELAKNNVIDVQDKLFKCQDERRHLNNQAGLIAEKLKEVYGELVQTKRDDPKYVQLTILENKGLQEQTRIGNQLRLLENAERDHFTRLATAIKEYHDSQAMNAQKYKYLSILASATLAIVSLCGSMIYNNRRIKDVRRVIMEGQIKTEAMFTERFDSLERKVGHREIIVRNNSFDDESGGLIPYVDSGLFSARNICIGILVLILLKAVS